MECTAQERAEAFQVEAEERSRLDKDALKLNQASDWPGHEVIWPDIGACAPQAMIYTLPPKDRPLEPQVVSTPQHEEWCEELQKTHRHGMVASSPGWIDGQYEEVASKMKLAEALTAQLHWARAEELYRKVVMIAPAYCGGHEALGAALCNQGRHAEAETVLQYAVKLYCSCLKAPDTDEARALVLLATAQAGQSRWEHALVSNRRAVELDPTSLGPKTALDKNLRLFRLLKQAAEPLQPPCKPKQMKDRPRVDSRYQSESESDTDDES